MRIRSIKPEFWRSRHVALLPWDLRLLFIGLWSYVDDNGVGVDDPWQIAADVFPVDPDPVDVRARVTEGLARLSREVREGSPTPFIVRYEVSGKRYLHITGWPHQRIDKPSKPRYPLPVPSAPTSGNPDPDDDPRDGLASVPEETPAVTEEQGNRGTEEQTLSLAVGSHDADSFARFWAVYPRRVGKAAALNVWKRVTKKVDPNVIVEAARRYAATRDGQDPTYTKHPKTWLNSGCWDDEPDPTPLRLVSNGYEPYRDPEDMSGYEGSLLS